ncbi:MAG: hypothetical protein WCI05_11090, partial [Myxococcales bacterium]
QVHSVAAVLAQALAAHLLPSGRCACQRPASLWRLLERLSDLRQAPEKKSRRNLPATPRG